MQKYINAGNLSFERIAEEMIIKAINKGLFKKEYEIKTIGKLLKFLNECKEVKKWEKS